MNILTLLYVYKHGHKSNLYSIIPKRFMAFLGVLGRCVFFVYRFIWRWVFFIRVCLGGFGRWVLLNLDGEATNGKEFEKRERGVRERAFAKGKREKFEVGKPGYEERTYATKVHRIEGEREG